MLSILISNVVTVIICFLFLWAFDIKNIDLKGLIDRKEENTIKYYKFAVVLIVIGGIMECVISTIIHL